MHAAALCNSPTLEESESPKLSSSTTEDKVDIYAGDVSATGNLVSLKDDVEISYLGQTIKTNIAEYNSETGQVTTPETVSLESKIGAINGLTAEFDLSTQTAKFKNSEFILESGSRGSAEELNLQENQQSLKGVIYSGCRKDSTGWELIAPEIVLDQETQRGYARNMKLEFANIPIFYVPYFSFPLNQQRKTGFLMPNVSTSDKNGLEFGVPFYWNISPNLDATFSPLWLTERGLQIQNEFRHILPFSQGTVNLDLLFNDEKRGGSRRYFNWENTLQYGNNWDFNIDFSDVSDVNYFVDFGGALSNTAISNLNREFRANYYGRYWQFQGLIQDYQVIDPRIGANQEPYQRLPQLELNANYPLFVRQANENQYQQSIHFKLDTELVNFRRDTGIESVRANIYPQIEHKYNTPALNVTTNIGLQHTRYELSSLPSSTSDDSLSRTLPILNVDMRLNLDRNITHKYLPSTIQPRAQYTNLTRSQLFNPMRFNGIDRIGDTQQLALGVSGWVLGNEFSEKQVSFDIGQVFYLEDRQVGLENDSPFDQQSSEIIAESYWQPNSRLGLRTGFSWDPDTDGTVKRQLGLSYRPNDRKLINLGYRFVRDQVDQADVAFRYPINQRLNFVGRWNYDRLNSTTLDRYWGVEYETCCWGIRAISRRYLSDRDGNFDTTFLLQLELKGLSSVGARADKLLQEDIFIDSP